MKFEAYVCPSCGYRLMTANPTPSCPECEKEMTIMTDNEDRKTFSNEIKKRIFNL
jgi:uncharacterized Zn finger protein (UPF0148 family)